MRKSLTKRIKITKRGRIVRRSMAVGHFRARKRGVINQGKRRTRSLDYPVKKLLQY